MTATPEPAGAAPRRCHPAERVQLSRHEERLLVCLERAMLRADPRWVTRFEARASRADQSGRRWPFGQ